MTACEKHFPDQQRYNGILLLLTPTKTQKLLLFSSISLFKMKRSTKYQAQGKAKQKRRTTVAAATSEWRKFGQEQSTQQQRYLEAMDLNAGEFKYDVINFSDLALPYSLSILVFTAHLIYNSRARCKNGLSDDFQ